MLETERARAILQAGPKIKTQKVGAWEPQLLMMALKEALTSLLLLELIDKGFQHGQQQVCNSAIV